MKSKLSKKIGDDDKMVIRDPIIILILFFIQVKIILSMVWYAVLAGDGI